MPAANGAANRAERPSALVSQRTPTIRRTIGGRSHSVTNPPKQKSPVIWRTRYQLLSVTVAGAERFQAAFYYGDSRDSGDEIELCLRPLDALGVAECVREAYLPGSNQPANEVRHPNCVVGLLLEPECGWDICERHDSLGGIFPIHMNVDQIAELALPPDLLVRWRQQQQREAS
jgi:hypothetical protein